MGVIDAPQWLLPAYIRSMKAVGATAPLEQLQAASERLIAMWRSPDRRFHNLKHAIDMLARVDELADESHNPDIMRLAVWYHGCVFSSATEQTYKRNGGEDEVASAAYAAQDLSGLGVPDKVTDRVCALILNLKRHNLTGEDIDARALNDADLGTLAVEPQQYKRYRELVREEYAHIPDLVYLRARLAIVTRLLERDQLFSSPLGQRWELPARQNLDAEKRRLTDQLAALERAAAEQPGTDEAGQDGAQQAGQDGPAGAGRTGAEQAGQAGHAGPAGQAGPAPTQAGGTLGSAAADADTATTTAATAAVTMTGTPPSAGISASATPSSGVRRVSIIPQASDALRPATAPRSVPSPASMASAPDRLPVTQRPADERADLLEHTTTMEACVADIDRLMTTPRQVPVTPAVRRTGPAPVVPERRSLVEAAQASLADKLQAKAARARAAREARTGELATITGEVPQQAAPEEPAPTDAPA